MDLLYVGIIAVIGDKAAEDATGFGLLRFSITFILGWKMWSDLTLAISWFGNFSVSPGSGLNPYTDANNSRNKYNAWKITMQGDANDHQMI